MPYTLAMFFLWGVGMALVGAVIGWLLRSLRSRTQLARARASAVDQQELQQLRARAAEFDAVAQERDRLRMELADVRGRTAGDVGFASRPPLDLDAASSVLGRDVDLDDLTMVVGIGPKVVELCAGIGVTTWRQLADTEPSMLKTMLDDGGSRFKTLDHSTWTHQAELLADGRWAEFKALVADLDAAG